MWAKYEIFDILFEILEDAQALFITDIKMWSDQKWTTENTGVNGV